MVNHLDSNRHNRCAIAKIAYIIGPQFSGAYWLRLEV